MIDILMPALSPTMEEGTLAKWLVKEGDSVEAGQVIAEIETDKATMEVEAVDEGVLDAILVAAGSEGVKVNTPIARLKGDGEEGAAPAPVATGDDQPTPGASASDPRAVREEVQELAEGGPDGPTGPGAGKGRVEARNPTDVGGPPQSAGADSSPKGGASDASASRSSPSGEGGREAAGGGRVFASPLARRLAKQKGVDLAAFGRVRPAWPDRRRRHR